MTCDPCFYHLFAFKFDDFNSTSCKSKEVLVFLIYETEITFESLAPGFSQFDHLTSDMNFVVLDYKFELCFWEFEFPRSFQSF